MMRTQSYRRVSFSASFKPGVVSSSLMCILHQGVLSGDIKVPSDENPELWKGLFFFLFFKPLVVSGSSMCFPCCKQF